MGVPFTGDTSPPMNPHRSRKNGGPEFRAFQLQSRVPHPSINRIVQYSIEYNILYSTEYENIVVIPKYSLVYSII